MNGFKKDPLDYELMRDAVYAMKGRNMTRKQVFNRLKLERLKPSPQLLEEQKEVIQQIKFEVLEDESEAEQLQ